MPASKDLRVVLVNMPVPQLDDDRRQPPGGLVSLATCASNAGYSVIVKDLSGTRLSIPELCDRLLEGDVYGFSTYTVTYPATLAIVNELRRRQPGALCIAGGPHASAMPGEVAQSFDIVTCGEGEYALVDVLRRIEQGSLRRSAEDQAGEIIRAAPIEKLDELPFPDYYQFCDPTGYNRQLNGHPAISLDSSRGCNNRCKFCNSRVIERGQWRMRSAANVAAEVRWHFEHGWRAFRFNDDNFLVDRQRVLQICRLLRPLAIEFRIFGRAQCLDDELCDALAGAGCRHIGVGIESLSPFMLSRMGKGARMRQICDGIRSARRAGIVVRGYFICGFPGETDQTISESLDGLSRLELDEAVVYPCIPYPGTDLFANPGRHGITWIDSDYSNYVQVGANRSAGFVMRTDTFGPDEVRSWRDQYIRAFEALGIRWSSEGEFAV